VAASTTYGLDEQPDFVVFTGDLTQTTDDRKIRRDRRAEFRDIVSQFKVKTVRFMPGEHDASLDRGEAYQKLLRQGMRMLRCVGHDSTYSWSPSGSVQNR
jgi:3',5'-cyclic AMP phosphodiesterase CpdA